MWLRRRNVSWRQSLIIAMWCRPPRVRRDGEGSSSATPRRSDSCADGRSIHRLPATASRRSAAAQPRYRGRARCPPPRPGRYTVDLGEIQLVPLPPPPARATAQVASPPPLTLLPPRTTIPSAAALPLPPPPSRSDPPLPPPPSNAIFAAVASPPSLPKSTAAPIERRARCPPPSSRRPPRRRRSTRRSDFGTWAS